MQALDEVEDGANLVLAAKEGAAAIGQMEQGAGLSEEAMCSGC